MPHHQEKDKEKKMTEKVSTGVKGLDKLIDGGVPKGSIVLYDGAPGTGKSILAMHFLEAGLKSGEKCIYISLEESPEAVLSQAKQFGMFKKAPEVMSANNLKYTLDKVMSKKPANLMEKTRLLGDAVKKGKFKCAVIDSVSFLKMEDDTLYRLSIQKLNETLRAAGVTTVLVGESVGDEYCDKITPFSVDGIIKIAQIDIGGKKLRNIEVRKMRSTKVDSTTHSFEIGNKGIDVGGEVGM